MTMVRPCDVVEDRITLLIRSFGAYYVYGTFAAGSHRVYVTVRELRIAFPTTASLGHP